MNCARTTTAVGGRTQTGAFGSLTLTLPDLRFWIAKMHGRFCCCTTAREPSVIFLSVMSETNDAAAGAAPEVPAVEAASISSPHQNPTSASAPVAATGAGSDAVQGVQGGDSGLAAPMQGGGKGTRAVANLIFVLGFWSAPCNATHLIPLPLPTLSIPPLPLHAVITSTRRLAPNATHQTTPRVPPRKTRRTVPLGQPTPILRQAPT